MDLLDTRRWAFVGKRSKRRFPGPRSVVGVRGDRQVPADRLNPTFVPGIIDELNHLFSGRSGSAAKKADAAFTSAFARRSSRTSRSNATSRACSSVVVPGRALR